MTDWTKVTFVTPPKKNRIVYYSLEFFDLESIKEFLQGQGMSDDYETLFIPTNKETRVEIIG